MSYYVEIDKAIQKALFLGYKKFIIYPFGEDGILTKRVLEERYNIKEIIIVDNLLSKQNSKIISVEELVIRNKENYAVIYTSTRKDLYDILEAKGFESLFPILDPGMLTTANCRNIGEMSYGGILNDAASMKIISSIGSFCSFAPGTCAVPNHPLNLVSTHPFLYSSLERWKAILGEPRRSLDEYNRKITIGNDVWLGRNVVIVQGVTIGNGVIAGAGAVITKNVPDYAVVAGVPAKIIRYRFSKEQIEALNRIKWWEWSLEMIGERRVDFEDINKFIKKYDVNKIF